MDKKDELVVLAVAMGDQRLFIHWDWYIGRLADIAVAHITGSITDEEYAESRRLYEWLWLNCDTYEGN